MIDPVVAFTLRAGLALLLASAALAKGRDLAGFRAVLRDYRLLPSGAASPVALCIIAFEGLAAASLLLPAAARAGALLAAALLGLYAAAIAINLARGRHHIDCGCGGPFRRGDRQVLSGWLLVRNAVLVAASAVATLPVSPRPLVWLDGLTLAFALSTLVLLWLALAQLATEWPELKRLRRAG